MKSWILVAAVACVLSASAFAERGESIMFGNDAPSLARDPSAQGDDSGIRCEELLTEISSLKGKPQRRMAAQQRYDAECNRDTAPPASSPN